MALLCYRIAKPSLACFCSRIPCCITQATAVLKMSSKPCSVSAFCSCSFFRFLSTKQNKNQKLRVTRSRSCTFTKFIFTAKRFLKTLSLAHINHLLCQSSLVHSSQNQVSLPICVRNRTITFLQPFAPFDE